MKRKIDNKLTTKFLQTYCFCSTIYR